MVWNWQPHFASQKLFTIANCHIKLQFHFAVENIFQFEHKQIEQLDAGGACFPHSLKHSIDCRWWCWCENRFNPVEMFHALLGKWLTIPHRVWGRQNRCNYFQPRISECQLDVSTWILTIYFWFIFHSICPAIHICVYSHSVELSRMHAIIKMCKQRIVVGQNPALSARVFVFVSVCITLFMLDFILFIRSNSNVICVETNKLEVSTISHHFQIINCTQLLYQLTQSDREFFSSFCLRFHFHVILDLICVSVPTFLIISNENCFCLRWFFRV